MNKILHLITQVTNLINQSSKWTNFWCLIFSLGPPTLPSALLPKLQMAASRPFILLLLTPGTLGSAGKWPLETMILFLSAWSLRVLWWVYRNKGLSLKLLPQLSRWKAWLVFQVLCVYTHMCAGQLCRWKAWFCFPGSVCACTSGCRCTQKPKTVTWVSSSITLRHFCFQLRPRFASLGRLAPRKPLAPTCF